MTAVRQKGEGQGVGQGVNPGEDTGYFTLVFKGNERNSLTNHYIYDKGIL